MPPQPAHRPRRARAFDLSAGARSAVFALLTAHFLLGAAQVASLPPFEGFDETGHYSSIQQVADLGSVPRLPDARMSQQIGKYAADARRPYESSPPFDRPDRWTYRRFFGAGDDVVAAGRRAAHDVPEETRHFAAGSVENYIAQHPPLFAAMGGLAAALAARFSLSGWLEGLSTFLGMAAWSSTWSLARPSLAFFVPRVLRPWRRHSARGCRSIRASRVWRPVATAARWRTCFCSATRGRSGACRAISYRRWLPDGDCRGCRSGC